jgi:ABC-2 type transport system ATP-binding protein
MVHVDSPTKYYSDTCAVDHVSFDVQKGEVVGFLGPNGAGKTTTMRIITCYLKPTSGTVRVKDFDIREQPLEVKRLIGYLPENAPLYTDMITYDYLRYVASIRGVPAKATRSRIDELVGICGLQGVMHKNVGELSRGYRQRVGLAHAMMSDPELLVLDEPTSGLDPNQIIEIREIIKQIGREKTVIFSTHILSEAEATCDRILIINRGKLVADGTTEMLSAETANESVVRIGVAGAGWTQVQAALSSVDGVSRVEQVAPPEDGADTNAIFAHAYCSGDLREPIFRKVVERNWVLIEFMRERRSLENVFQQLTLSQQSEPQEA